MFKKPVVHIAGLNKRLKKGAKTMNELVKGITEGTKKAYALICATKNITPDHIKASQYMTEVLKARLMNELNELAKVTHMGNEFLRTYLNAFCNEIAIEAIKEQGFLN